MNEVIGVINNRRSIRFYQNDGIEKEVIETIINAGNMAPTGTNQSWRFIVVDSQEILKKLRDMSLPLYESFMKNMPEDFKKLRDQIDSKVSDPVFYSAPVVIYVVGTGMASDIDCSMVCQNMMLAAESLGLNSCYVYFGQLVTSHSEVKTLFNIKENEKVYGPVLIGKGVDGIPTFTSKKNPEVTWL